MSRLKVSTREIGNVKVFDLLGDPDQESLMDVAWKIQRSIRRHRLQRVILNVQKVKNLDEISIRRLIAAFIRPQRSVIFGASEELTSSFEETYLPKNVRLCPTEKEVAEDFGPFLFHKDELGNVLGEAERHLNGEGGGLEFERRRSKRMHVAIPLDFTLLSEGQPPIRTRAISTNVSDGGIFVEFLDLDALKRIAEIEKIERMKVAIDIHPSENFPEDYHLEGEIRRKEERKHGLGLAIKFTPAKLS